ncbi:hypothetical protein PI124_g14665 [Phytophthora idaei]|nr:hypothetical protein PI125_g14424 [Phytophthora idaei]KAG3145776.1 hypothetical protein PI126_g13603 [Phytophthora idaei]KAG3240449.1 hypothetical protein PI124_g14665 [Phytophthora idaei]
MLGVTSNISVKLKLSTDCKIVDPDIAVLPDRSTMSMAARLRYFINSPTGPKTTHFWGPVANWGFVLAAMADMQKPADVISINMTSALSIYSLIFMRFAWMVKPRNYLLLACHASNETAQLYQLQRGVRYQASKKAAEKQA